MPTNSLKGKRLRRTYWWLADALVLTLCGLARVDYIHCEMIAPGWPAFRSDYVEACASRADG